MHIIGLAAQVPIRGGRLSSNVRPLVHTVNHIATLACALLLVACGDRLSPQAIETPRGTVTYKERVRPDDGKFEEGLRDVSSSEADRLRQSALQAPTFIARHVPAAQMQSDQLENLDLAFAAWLNSTDPKKESPAEVESIVGAALGQYCIAKLPVRWAVATDSRGTEFVLVGENPPSRSYPLAAVRYRIEDRKTDFIGALYEALVHLRAKAS